MHSNKQTSVLLPPIDFQPRTKSEQLQIVATNNTVKVGGKLDVKCYHIMQIRNLKV